MKFALFAVQRAREQLALHVIPMKNGAFVVPSGKAPAYVALIATFRTDVLAERAREHAEGARTIANVAVRFSSGGVAIVAMERDEEPLLMALLRASGSALPIPSGDHATVAVLGCYSTQPIAAIRLSRIRSMDTLTISEARAVAAVFDEEVAA